MDKLDQLTCEPCHHSSAPLNEQEISQLILCLSDWQVLDDKGVNKLFKTYRFKSYEQAMKFANKLARIAESQNHHPEMLIEWGKVSITWWTHEIDGLHKNDFILASKTDLLIQESHEL